MENETTLASLFPRTSAETAALAAAYVLSNPSDRRLRQVRAFEDLEVEPTGSGLGSNLVMPSCPEEASQVRLNNEFLYSKAEEFPRFRDLILQHVVEIYS